MHVTPRLRTVLMASVFMLAGCGMAAAGSTTRSLPDPEVDPTPAYSAQPQVAVLAGGCFWGMQAVFEHVRGVLKVTAGFAGGRASTARYERVSEGDTGHAEAVRIVYDPATVSYGQLLKVFFQVAHDPTELDRQGPDQGTQYRSDIFYANPQQKRVATTYIRQLQEVDAFGAPIVTRVTPLHGFYPAEAYHQDYARKHPHDLYIVINDAPKLRHLQNELPSLYTAH